MNVAPGLRHGELLGSPVGWRRLLPLGIWAGRWAIRNGVGARRAQSAQSPDWGARGGREWQPTRKPPEGLPLHDPRTTGWYGLPLHCCLGKKVEARALS